MNIIVLAIDAAGYDVRAALERAATSRRIRVDGRQNGYSHDGGCLEQINHLFMIQRRHSHFTNLHEAETLPQTRLNNDTKCKKKNYFPLVQYLSLLHHVFQITCHAGP